jgi:SAM-dependent methyltransferase
MLSFKAQGRWNTVEPTKAEVHSAVADGYGRAAATYARARPSYPDAAVEWLLTELAHPSRVVEVGAGTGKFTAQLIEREIAVLAVEPVPAMRERLSTLGDLVTVIDATAEHLPFATGSVDSLVASQSLHWADVVLALAEFDRILGRAGHVALIWNFRDIDVPWQRDLDAMLRELRGDAPHSRDGRWERAVDASALEIVASEVWRWSVPTNEAGVLDRVRSVSYVAAMVEDGQLHVDERVRGLLRKHGLSTERPFEFPYLTEAYVLRRRAAAARAAH